MTWLSAPHKPANVLSDLESLHNKASKAYLAPAENEAGLNEPCQAAELLPKAAPERKRRGRPRKAALKTTNPLEECTPTMLHQAVVDLAEQKPSERRSGRRHTKRGVDGKFYDQGSPAAQSMPDLALLEEVAGDFSASQTCREAALDCHPEEEKPPRALQSLASEGSNARLAAKASKAEGSSKNAQLSKEQFLRKPAISASPLELNARSEEARPAGQGRMTRQPTVPFLSYFLFCMIAKLPSQLVISQ